MYSMYIMYILYIFFTLWESLGRTCRDYKLKKEILHTPTLNNQMTGYNYAFKFSPYKAILQKLIRARQSEAVSNYLCAKYFLF